MKKTLVVVGEALFDEEFHNYFSSFGFEVIYSTTFLFSHDEIKSFGAVLINCSVIQCNFTLIYNLYHQYAIPIIIVSDTYNEDLCVRMLEAGADDFIIKPIHPRELHARICAISRRVQQAQDEKDILTFANWQIHLSSRQLFNGAAEQTLSIKEYNLLIAFLDRPQQLLSRMDLATLTNCKLLANFERHIALQVYRLRQKIEANPKNPVLIKTFRNMGYIFTAKVTHLYPGN